MVESTNIFVNVQLKAITIYYGKLSAFFIHFHFGVFYSDLRVGKKELELNFIFLIFSIDFGYWSVFLH